MADDDSGATPRFLVDENAARLARWLRLLGYDAVYQPGADDAELVERARAEVRVLVTRDRGIMARRPVASGEARALRRPVASGEARALLLDSDDTWRQLEQVVDALRDLETTPRPVPFTRCAACNGTLEAVSADEARPHVPPFVAATQRQFTHCPACGRYYWRGTHWQRVTARLATLTGR